MAWAIEQQTVTAPSTRHVLLCLANYADQNGSAVFPSVARLSADTGLDRRNVQRHLRKLEALGVLRRNDPGIPAAFIRRADRRPVSYRLVMTGRQVAAPCEERGGGAALTGRQIEQTRGGGVPPDPPSDPPLIRQAKTAAAAFAREFSERFGAAPAPVPLRAPKRGRPN